MKELKDIAKENPFRVPDNYFEGLTERIVSTATAETPSIMKKSNVRRLTPYLVAAATVAALALLGYAGFYMTSKNSRQADLQEITLSEQTAIELNEIDLFTLEERIAEEGPSMEIKDISNNEIIDYLVSENIDILDIYEQL